ncbi:carboxymuconolactone decarboxylase family protein [Methanonatronarchaeum sp. AMET6-2]|uniref:carboxymuconolactone decarboxylase family protein n=1 Tax=Methanonatronarchaeum sp. AMET6-2 TaxID=2933293 RepID=UPI00121C0F6B|nr:carboxymuconolactone decarboxylase family protein [Methanonatronarchaeum sp. AMET6-2]RZN62864.1 MAG: carboxymuconolactone decarboxylase family protein [Methanonatronarchaeia archaeon]UOY09476.1 carboxymuconolactone decarboxylase family protein [Methanonatronarchaeum sp. AMET6-2]
MTEKDEQPDKILKNIEEKTGFLPQILRIIEDVDPKHLKRYNMCNNKILTDGALPAKTKILVALAVVASKQCEPCTKAQMKSALNNGATKEEIMELMEVIFITAGAPAVAACKDALKLLKEHEKQNQP